MRSGLVERLGVQVPQVVHKPPHVASLAAAEDAIELADAYGLASGFPLDESQRFTLRTAMGERVDGSWAASIVGDFEPRQSGKNDTVAAREFAGLILFGEQLQIHTAHEFQTANESFLRLVALFENWDDLRSKVRRILYGNGTQSINLLSGQRILYKARTAGAGRGFAKADLVVYDEAQEVLAEHIAASGPARLANLNSQAWYCGSGGLAKSASAWRLRRRALSGDGGRLAYVEHTAEILDWVDGRVVSSIPVDVLDRDAWARAHPAYNHPGRVADEGMLTMYHELGPELFAREGLCIWDPEPGDSFSVIPSDAWHACLEQSHKPSGRLAYALDCGESGEWTSVAASDGTHVEIVANKPGTAWVVPACVEKKAVFGAIVIDPASHAGSLIVPLEQAGVTVRQVKGRDYQQACAGFLDGVTGVQVRHIGQPELDTACAGAGRRSVSDAWVWSRRTSTVDIAPLVAVTLARWAAGTGSGPANFFTI